MDDLTARDASSFRVEPEAEGVWLNVKRAKRFGYHFLTEAPEALLRESYIGLNGTPYGLRWKYEDFRALERKQFPVSMKLAFEGGKKLAKASIALSRISTNGDWEARTEVSKKYKKVELEEILKILLEK